MELSREVPQSYPPLGPVVRLLTPVSEYEGTLPAPWTGYIRIQRSKAERRANRIAGQIERKEAARKMVEAMRAAEHAEKMRQEGYR